MATGLRPAGPPSPGPAAPGADLPPLENGDHLTRAEFERRAQAQPMVRAELVEGVVFMTPPVAHREHGVPHLWLGTWIGLYRAATPGTEAADNASIRLDAENLLQPDLYLMILPSHGGQARLGPDRYVEGAPELIVEIASTSASYDLHAKREAYRRNGVREYLVWRTRDAALDWWTLRDGQFEPIAPDADGLRRSIAFPGLWLDSKALLGGDLAGVVATGQRGIAAAEHAGFVAELARRAAGAEGPRP